MEKVKYYYKTKEWRNEYAAKWRLTHKEKGPEKIVRDKKAHLRRRYGLTLEQVEEIRKSQNDVCAICGGEFGVYSTVMTSSHTPKTKACIDHDHITGKVRGILCRRCNILIGHAEDSVETLEKAISYLKKFGEENVKI